MPRRSPTSISGEIPSLELRRRWRSITLLIGSKIPLHPKYFTWIKLFILTPLIVLILPLPLPPFLTELFSLSLSSSITLSSIPKSVGFIVFALFLFCDLLRKAKVRATLTQIDSTTHLDRFGGYPLTLFVLWSASPYLSAHLLIAKGVLDTLTLLLSTLGRGPAKSRLRTALSETTLFALLCLSLQWAPRLISSETVSALLTLHIIYLVLVFASQVRLLQKRFIADALSFSNLLCGLASIYFSSKLAFDVSLLYLLLGAAFDGFDGAAARKFGGTRWGVYSDDIADGVNYGVAPGFALYYLLGGLEGLIIGLFYAFFTMSRLIFFTLNKDESDPNYFSGVPSPVGGMIVMCSIVLFKDQPTWVTFLVGVACTQMVSFSTHYRHLGRALSKNRRTMFGAPAYLLVFLFGALLWGVKGAAGIVLISACFYGFLPSLLSFIYVLKRSSPKVEEEGEGSP